jgi:2-oxoglutarate ferredoxin oxidoreductase subunit beta
MTEMVKLTPRTFATDQEVRWCPGCGDYAVLKAVQRTLPELGVDPARTVFVSGIGCSSRFPYYMETYGFHTIHGRAPAFATGIKLANPELDVWIITGDGDALSIGGNHTMHILRRNLDCQILLFNNEIYGLTKGAIFSHQPGRHALAVHPFGSVDRPVSPCAFALGSGARFVARGIDVHKNLPAVLKAAHGHRGASFVEIYQNCIVYNDDVFAPSPRRRIAGTSCGWRPGSRCCSAATRRGAPRASRSTASASASPSWTWRTATGKRPA